MITFTQNLLEIREKEGGKTMAKPIKETPILFGEDARRFEARMKEKRTESPEEREKRLKAYYLIMSIMES